MDLQVEAAELGLGSGIAVSVLAPAAEEEVGRRLLYGCVQAMGAQRLELAPPPLCCAKVGFRIQGSGFRVSVVSVHPLRDICGKALCSRLVNVLCL